MEKRMTEGNYFDGWRFLSLPEVCDINPPRPRNLMYPDETLTSFVPMAAVDDQQGKIVDLQTRPFGEIKRGYTYFEENDVLFAKITPCMENGKSAIARGLINNFGFGSTEFHVLRPHQSILPEWLYYFVRREPFRQEAKANFRGAVGQQRVTQEFLSNYLIPVPYPSDPEKSLATQTRIILRIEAVYRELTEARRLHEKIVADTNRLMDAVLAEYFPRFGVALPNGWDWKPISFLAHDTDRQNPALTTPNEYFNYIDISSVDNAIGAVTDPKRLPGQDAPSRARKIVHTNDVIFATTRPYLKNIALVPPNLDHSICSTGFCVLVPKGDNCVPQFLYYAARSESVIQQLIPKQRGASYPAVLDQDIFGTFIPVPYPGDPERSKTVQEIIAKRITEMQESVSEAQLGNTKTGALLNQMEQSILAQAFRGEL
jgi:type I restriction enzyme S subunit